MEPGPRSRFGPHFGPDSRLQGFGGSCGLGGLDFGFLRMVQAGTGTRLGRGGRGDSLQAADLWPWCGSRLSSFVCC